MRHDDRRLHALSRRDLMGLGLACAAWPNAKAGERPLKVAFVYVGPVGDGGWTFAHDTGRRQAEQALGDSISTTWVENVPESDRAEAVFEQLVRQGHQLIFATTFGYMEPLLRVAARHPEVRFEHATGYKQTPNLRTYDVRFYEAAYLAGIVAGRTTRTHRLGVVASIPIPEVIRNINAFTLGARSVNPRATTRVAWVNKWFDPPGEAAAARSLIGQQVDVLMQNTDSSAVLETAQASGVRAFGMDSDMSAYAPKAHLGSIVGLWGGYCTESIRQVQAGTWQSGAAWLGLRDEAVDLVSLAADLPAAVSEEVGITRQLMRQGLSPWMTMMRDNQGRVVADKAGVTDRMLVGMYFFVEGVIGRVPRP